MQALGRITQLLRWQISGSPAEKPQGAGSRDHTLGGFLGHPFRLCLGSYSQSRK